MSNSHDEYEDEHDGVRYPVEYHDDEELAVVKPKHNLPVLLASLGLGDVSTKDEIKVQYRNGMITASVKQPDGVTQTARQTVRAGFKMATEFDPNSMGKDDRNDLIRQEYRRGRTQTELAMQFGLSQSMIQRIVSG